MKLSRACRKDFAALGKNLFPRRLDCSVIEPHLHYFCGVGADRFLRQPDAGDRDVNFGYVLRRPRRLLLRCLSSRWCVQAARRTRANILSCFEVAREPLILFRVSFSVVGRSVSALRRIVSACRRTSLEPAMSSSSVRRSSALVSLRTFDFWRNSSCTLTSESKIIVAMLRAKTVPLNADCEFSIT